jgi:hypothetical protein
MKSDKEIKHTIPQEPENPFRVPDGYFDSLRENVMDKIRAAETPETGSAGKQKIHLRPYLSLAATISGLALIIYILLQAIVGNRMEENGLYDLAILEKTGITNDEAILMEAYAYEEENTYDDWDEQAMVYLSSNEVDLMLLLESNE